VYQIYTAAGWLLFQVARPVSMVAISLVSQKQKHVACVSVSHLINAGNASVSNCFCW
jgi:hypothetical protein